MRSICIVVVTGLIMLGSALTVSAKDAAVPTAPAKADAPAPEAKPAPAPAPKPASKKKHKASPDAGV